MISYLIKLADHLDRKGFSKEAEYIDALLKRAGEIVDLDKYRREKIGREKEQHMEFEDSEVFDEEDLETYYQDMSEFEEDRDYDIEEYDNSERVMIVVLDDGETYSMDGEVYFLSPSAAQLLEEGGVSVEEAVRSDLSHKSLGLKHSRDKLLEIIDDSIEENLALDHHNNWMD